MRRTTNLTQIDILGSAEKLISDVLVLIVKYVAIIAALALMPAVFTVWPLWVYLRNPMDYLWFTWVAAIIYWATPFSCAFYMFFLAHWHSIHYWRKMYGDTEGWRKAHGGIVGTTLKCFFFMFVGLVGSFFFEILYLRTSNYIGIDLYLPDYWRTELTFRYALGYALLPLAAFAPVILLCLWRWLWSRKIRSLTAQPSLTIPEQIAKTIGEGNLRQTLEIAKRGPEAAALVGQALEDHFRERAAGCGQAAQSMREEAEREEADAKMKRERELELLRRIDAQIALMGDETANN